LSLPVGRQAIKGEEREFPIQLRFPVRKGMELCFSFPSDDRVNRPPACGQSELSHLPGRNLESV